MYEIEKVCLQVGAHCTRITVQKKGCTGTKNERATEA